jgi:ABC-type uncharacterized transport system auxiliary subunit
MKHIAILALVLSLGACTIKRAVNEEPFIVNFESPRIQAGTFEAQFDKTVALMGLRQVEVTVSYFPIEDAVCLQYRIDLMTYYLFWNREGRETYIKALEKYKEDFTQRNIKTKGNRNTRRKYGKADCYLIWQAAAFLTRSRASNVTEIGYDIKDIEDNKASFFSLWQRESVYIAETAQQELRNSPNILIYLTRAKADELAGLFNQDLLESLVPDSMKRNNKPIIPDIF